MKDNNKEEKGFIDKISDNRNLFFSFLGGVLVTAVICGILWPSRLAKLSDGSDIIASFNDTNVSADALYKDLSSRGGLSTLLEIVDKNILLDKYNLKDEAAAYAEEQSQSHYQQWESIYGMTKEEFLSNNGFTTEDEFMEYLEFEFYKNTYSTEYLNSKVSDEEVEDYYNDVVKEERRAYVFYSAEENKDLEKVRKALKKGTSVEDLSNKYSSVTYRDLGNVNFNSYNIYTENFLNKLNKLGKKETSEVFEDENFGYVVVYVSNVEEKEKLEDIKDDIRSNLATKLNENDPNLYYRGFQELREEYGFKIEDANLKKEYEDFIKSTKE